MDGGTERLGTRVANGLANTARGPTWSPPGGLGVAQGMTALAPLPAGDTKETDRGAMCEQDFQSHCPSGCGLGVDWPSGVVQVDGTGAPVHGPMDVRRVVRVWQVQWLRRRLDLSQDDIFSQHERCNEIGLGQEM